jgi:hypothetical protein
MVSFEASVDKCPPQPWGKSNLEYPTKTPKSLMHTVFVRIGSLGEVHAAHSQNRVSYGRRVLVRTARGVELAEVLGSRRDTSTSKTASTSSWEILRATTPEDELLIERLQRHKREAVEACRNALTESGSRAVLLDVDQLFDGATLIMHFLGDVDEVAEKITQQVARRYESIVRTEHFATLLQEGCGPNCGTGDETGGCGSGCAGCAAKIVCHTR